MDKQPTAHQIARRMAASLDVRLDKRQNDEGVVAEPGISR